MKKSLIAPAFALAIGVCASLPAAAQFAKPEDALKYRQSVMRVMATHFGRVGAMANGKVPFDAKAAQDDMVIVETMSKLPWPGFTGGAAGGKSKPEIWTEQAKFKELSEKMMTEVSKLNAAAKTGNVDNLKTAFNGAGGSCKACHDAFQEK
jgi:cytochrome c556